MQVLYRIVGKGTSLLSTLRQGDSISAIGPLGNSFPLPAPGEEAVLVAGGMGIAPLYFLAQALQGNQGPTTVVLLGFSTSEEVVCPDCGGDGGFERIDGTFGAYDRYTGAVQTYWEKCTVCDGSREIEIEVEPITCEDLDHGHVQS